MDKQLAEAIVTTFREGAPLLHEARLTPFTLRDWERSYRWLDTSGLALYLLDRIKNMELENAIPSQILERLNRNQQDNQARTEEMFLEFAKINAEFQRADVRYLNLKGFTLIPRFCADPTLRFQADLDFLIAEEDAMHCKDILTRFGYLLIAKSGSAWEFKAGGYFIPSIQDMYKPKPQRSVELHLVTSESVSPSGGMENQLSRMKFETWQGITFPALCEIDKFIAQTEHLLKHLRGEWTRLSWIWEYRTFLVGNRNEDEFWGKVKERALQTGYGLGSFEAASRLTAKVFGPNVVPALDEWTVGLLPQPIDLWIDRYGRDLVLANFPGSKLYLLLREDRSGSQSMLNADRLKKLVPIRFPEPILVHTQKQGSTKNYWLRMLVELRYFFFRLRFHAASSLRYMYEIPRWKRASADFWE